MAHRRIQAPCLPPVTIEVTQEPAEPSFPWFHHDELGYGRLLSEENDEATLYFAGRGEATVPFNTLRYAPPYEIARGPIAALLPKPQPLTPIETFKPQPTANYPIRFVRPEPKRSRSTGKRREHRYRDDWNNDNSTVPDVHDVVAGSERRTDLSAFDWRAACEEQILRAGGNTTADEKDAIRSDRTADAQGSEEVGSTSKDISDAIDEHGKLTYNVIDGVTVSSSTERKVPTNRETKQRLSRHKRQLLKAYKLWLGGLSWDKVAKEMKISRAEARGMRNELLQLLGSSALNRNSRVPVGWKEKK